MQYLCALQHSALPAPGYIMSLLKSQYRVVLLKKCLWTQWWVTPSLFPFCLSLDHCWPPVFLSLKLPEISACSSCSFPSALLRGRRPGHVSHHPSRAGLPWTERTEKLLALPPSSSFPISLTESLGWAGEAVRSRRLQGARGKLPPGTRPHRASPWLFLFLSDGLPL